MFFIQSSSDSKNINDIYNDQYSHLLHANIKLFQIKGRIRESDNINLHDWRRQRYFPALFLLRANQSRIASASKPRMRPDRVCSASYPGESITEISVLGQGVASTKASETGYTITPKLHTRPKRSA